MGSWVRAWEQGYNSCTVMVSNAWRMKLNCNPTIVDAKLELFYMYDCVSLFVNVQQMNYTQSILLEPGLSQP